VKNARAICAAILALALLLSLPASGATDSARALRAVVLSDINGPYGSLEYPPAVARVIERVFTVWRPDLVLTAGDLVAGQSHTLPGERFQEMWAAFDRTVLAPLRRAGIPFAPAIGNHDGSSLPGPGGFAFQRERDAADRFWNTPGRDAGLEFTDRAAYPFWYSFTAGGVYFLVWDASSARILDLEWAWLALASPAAREARMRVVIGHLPLFGIAEGRNRPGEVITDGDTIRRRLEAAGVDLYISGHHAAYYPGRRGDLLLLHSGGIGGRSLVGSTAPPRSTVTLLTLHPAERRIELETFDALTFEQVDLRELPERIDGLGGSVTRMDLP
jgi:hypothetical protein